MGSRCHYLYCDSDSVRAHLQVHPQQKRRNAMKRLWISVLLLFVFSGLTAWAQQAPSTTKPNLTIVKPLVLYDDFNGPRINPAKWGSIDWVSGTPDVLETVRDLTPSYQGQGDNRFLRLFLRSYSLTGSDDGTNTGTFGLAFPAPGLITDVAFTVVVNKMELTGCQSNSSSGYGDVEFRGRFFNSEANPTGDQGDVEVILAIERDASITGDELRVSANISLNDPIQGWTMLDWRQLGIVYPRQRVKLRITWDQPNHQFIYRLNNEPDSIAPYYVADTSLARGLAKEIQLVRATPNCTTTPGASTTIDAYIDNVYVNAH